MKIGVPKEIKIQEYRVGLTPSGVRELTRHGHSVTVEHGAGLGIGYGDDAYQAAGAVIAASAAEVFETADMIIKVKEPQPAEIARPHDPSRFHRRYRWRRTSPAPRSVRDRRRGGGR